MLGLPVYLFNGVGAHFVGRAWARPARACSRWWPRRCWAGLLAVAFVVAVAYYGTIAAFRFGLDPDTYGIPLVTSSVDFVGALVLILVIVALGVGLSRATREGFPLLKKIDGRTTPQSQACSRRPRTPPS